MLKKSKIINSDSSLNEKLEFKKLSDFLKIYNETFYILSYGNKTSISYSDYDGYLKWNSDKEKELKIIYEFIKKYLYSKYLLTSIFSDLFDNPFLKIFLLKNTHKLIDTFDELQVKMIDSSIELPTNKYINWKSALVDLSLKLDKLLFSKSKFIVLIETIAQDNLIKLEIPKNIIYLFNEKMNQVENDYQNNKYEDCYTKLKDDIYSKIILNALKIINPSEIMKIFKKVLNIKENNEFYKWINQSFSNIGKMRNGIYKGELLNSQTYAKTINKDWNELNNHSQKLFTRLFIDNTKTLFNFLLEAKLLEKEIN